MAGENEDWQDYEAIGKYVYLGLDMNKEEKIKVIVGV